MEHTSSTFPFFSPIQPSLFQLDKPVVYRELRPRRELSKRIYCYWELYSEQALGDSFPYRVVADACMDVLWEIAAPQTPYVVGYSDSFTLFPLGKRFHYFGIRFLPAAFPLWASVKAAELAGCFETLDSVVPTKARDLSQVCEGLEDLDTLKERLDAFFLLNLAKDPKSMDPRFASALDQILRHHGRLSTTKDLDIGLSPRQLRRVFQLYIGDSPKSFCKVVRFQQLLGAKPSRESLRKNKLFFDLGYYDQAHFIKEFKQMYGVSPTSAFR